jgi:hypothetical protein
MARAIDQEQPDMIVTDCSLAGLRIEKENGRAPLHPIEALAIAYGLDEAPTTDDADQGATEGRDEGGANDEDAS